MTEDVDWAGGMHTTRWLLSLPPGRVLDRVEHDARRAGLGVRVEGHGFRLHVRAMWRRMQGAALTARVRRFEEGSEMEFGIASPLGGMPWLIPIILLGVILGAILGVGGYYA